MSAELVQIVSAGTQAFATVVLVGVTIFYAVQTKKTVDAMVNSHKAEFLPIIQIGFYEHACDERTLSIELTNIGKGMAKRQVSVTFPGVRNVYLNSIPVGGTEHVLLTYDIEYVLQLPERERRLAVSYRDVFGREVKTESMMVEKTRIVGGIACRYLCLENWEPIIP